MKRLGRLRKIYEDLSNDEEICPDIMVNNTTAVDLVNQMLLVELINGIHETCKGLRAIEKSIDKL